MFNFHLLGSPKKLRPKSLAIPTPTKLISLEEAQNRALTNLSASNSNHSQNVPISSANTCLSSGLELELPSIVGQDQKYIEVGGGASTLPQKYHTVIDIPGTR